MIISASFRTDIPAFYGEWFRQRLAAEYCLVMNPYDAKYYRVSLQRQDVDGYVFWTRNLGAFFPNLRHLQKENIPFTVHYTITGYPRALEPNVIRPDVAVTHMRTLADEFSPKAGVWCYDPIVIGNPTDYAFHRKNFTDMAQKLSGSTDEVVVSFAQIYKKTKRNMDAAAARLGFQWEDPDDDAKRGFMQELAQIAGDFGLKFSLCAQRQYLSPGINDASCIDVERLSKIAGFAIKGNKPGHRGKQCGCNQSRDIGAYDTCPHGCTYCYAVSDQVTAKKLYQQHDPRAEWLSPPRRYMPEKPEEQLPLFCRDQ